MSVSPFLHTAVHEPLLGTRVSVGVRAADKVVALAGEQAALAVFERLEHELSAFRPESAWCRWRTGDDTAATPAIHELLATATHWHQASGGVFNPAVGAFRAQWLDPTRRGSAPSAHELSATAAAIKDLPYRVDGQKILRLGDCTHLDLHSLAKGWIVDRAAEAAMAVEGMTEVLVNAGGDLRHIGGAAITVGVEDPRRPFDNAAALTRVMLGDGAVAGSSSARRPMVVGRRRLPHTIDPRSGLPAADTLAATVVAADAATADAVATIVYVLSPAEAVAWCDHRGDVACHVLTADGEQLTSRAWPR